MTLEEAGQFAEQWIKAWNSHDIDEILSHYTDDFELTSPMIQRVLGIESGTLRGKKAVGEYWRAALQKVPELHFTMIDVTCGVDSISIYYESVLKKKAIEMFHFQKDGKVFRSHVTYS